MVLNELERCAKRQLIERNRQSKLVRSRLTHWDALSWSTQENFRPFVDHLSRLYIKHLEAPMVENPLVCEPNMLRLVLILKTWQFGQEVEAMGRSTLKCFKLIVCFLDSFEPNVNLKNSVLSTTWFELLLLSILGRLDVANNQLRPLDLEHPSIDLADLELQPEFVGQLCALAHTTSELTTEQLAVMAALLVERRAEVSCL